MIYWFIIINYNVLNYYFWWTRVDKENPPTEFPDSLPCVLSERRGGAASWEDNTRRLSNPASMTPPLAGLLDYQPFAACETSAGSSTVATPHHSPPTAPHYRATAAGTGPGSAHPGLGASKLTRRPLFKLIWGQSQETVAIGCVPPCLKVWLWFQHRIGVLVWWCYWHTYADGLYANQVGVTSSFRSVWWYDSSTVFEYFYRWRQQGLWLENQFGMWKDL